MNVTPQQLSCFLRVAETGSFSEAAKRMNLSQPALSRTIRLMEEALGARLFDRDTRNVTPTPAGLKLRPVAERLLAEFEGAFGELAQFVAGREGRVIIAALPSIAAMLLPAAIAAMRATQPGVEITIRDGLSEGVLEAVAEGRAHIGLTVRPVPSSKLRYRPLCEDAFGLVCRMDSPLAVPEPASWRAFTEHPFVAMAPASSVRLMTDAAFLQAGLAVPPLYECSFLGTAGHLVGQDLGITAIPRLALPLLSAPGLFWRPLRHPEIRRQIGTVVRTSHALPPAAERMVALLEDMAREGFFGQAVLPCA